MTSRERMLAALRRESVDYVPCSVFFHSLNEGYRRNVPGGRRYNFPWAPSDREMLDYCVNELGLDQVVPSFCRTHTPAPDVSSKVWMEGAVIHKVWTTPAGDLRAAVRYDDKWPWDLDIPLFQDQNVAYFQRPWLETEQDLECLKYILRPPDDGPTLDRLRFTYDKAKHLADLWCLPTFAEVGLGLTGAMHLCGAAELCVLLVDKPGLVDAYLELEHRLNLRNLEIALDLGVDIVKRNGFYETADFYAPHMLDRFLSRRLNAEADMVREAGRASCYTVHTGVMPMLGYLRRLNFDCLMQVDTGFPGMDLEAFRDSQEGTKTFWLGPSDTYHIGKGPDVVRKALHEVFDVFDRRGLIVSASPAILSVDPWEDVLAMVGEWKRLRNDPGGLG